MLYWIWDSDYEVSWVISVSSHNLLMYMKTKQSDLCSCSSTLSSATILLLKVRSQLKGNQLRAKCINGLQPLGLYSSFKKVQVLRVNYITWENHLGSISFHSLPNTKKEKYKKEIWCWMALEILSAEYKF